MASNVQSFPLMLKAVVASSLLVGAVSLAFLACSTEEPSTFKPEDNLDGGPAPISDIVPEAGLDAAEGGPQACAPQVPDSFAPQWKAPTPSTACSTADVTGYWTACLADPGVTEGDGTCAAWRTAHAACATCAEPADGSGPVQWQLNRKFYTLNVGGCIAVQQGKPEATACGAKYSASVECKRVSCSYCFEQGGSFSQYTDCQRAAANEGVCITHDKALTTPCDGYKNAGSPALQCFNAGTTGDTAQVWYSRVIGLLCSPP